MTTERNMGLKRDMYSDAFDYIRGLALSGGDLTVEQAQDMIRYYDSVIASLNNEVEWLKTHCTHTQ